MLEEKERGSSGGSEGRTKRGRELFLFPNMNITLGNEGEKREGGSRN